MTQTAQNIARPKRILIKAGAAVLTAASLAVVAGAFLAPWLASQNSALAPHFYRFYGHICHQNPGRTPVFFGQPAAACGRCLGIYLGFLAGCLVILLFRNPLQAKPPRPWAFALASLPLGLDVLANFFNIWDLGNWFRLATGLGWGFILPFYALAGFVDLVLGKLAIRGAST